MAVLGLLSGTRLGFFLIFLTVVRCELKCDFEVDTCQWYLSNGWIRSQGKASHLDTGPLDERTNPDGFYLHLNLSHFQPDDKAFIFSPPVLDPKKKYCLSFFYLMHGKQVATLSVHLRNVTSSEEVWATSFEHGPEWLHQEVTIQNANQVMFEGVIGGELGDIGIDDVEINEGKCISIDNEAGPKIALPMKCTFEGSLCGFHNKHNTALKWKLGTGNTTTRDTGPDNDHTLRTIKGHYMYSAASVSHRQGMRAILVSPRYSPTGDVCIQFWYNMYGTHIKQLNVLIKRHIVWSRKGSQGYGWKSAFIQKRGNRPFKLMFVTINGSGRKGDIAIDDISIQNGKCPPPVDCSFENTLCGWSDSGDEDFDWTPRTGKPGKQSLGPSTDHTLQSEKGTYMIIESSSHRRRGDRARLVSTTITETVKKQCLKFWYNMNGKKVGELLVFIYTQYGKSLQWRLFGPQGGLWAFASVPIPPRKENFWFVIEGVIGEPSKSYIAFDDITLTEGDCQVLPSRAAIGWKTTTPQLPVTSTLPLKTVNPKKVIFNCDFTKDFCGWKQGPHNKVPWIRTHVSKHSRLTGPEGDHTTGKGSYIFVDSSKKIIGPVRLFSRTIKPSHQNMCLKFWYFMYGRDVDTLRVYISPGTHFQSDMNSHWKKSSSQPEKWILGEVLFQMKQSFQVVFEATLNGKIAGDIALDDILLTYGSCTSGEAITTSKPGITEKPISIEQRNCDFESSNICGYVHAKGSPNYFWRRSSGEADVLNSGPSTDHTTNSAEGHYMYIEGLGQKFGTVARMISPLYQDSTDVCLQFYYHMFGNGIGNFSIYLLFHGNRNDSQRIFSTSENHGPNWEVGRVDINKYTASFGYKIMFEASVGMNEHSDVALDDISFSPGKCPSLGDCDFEASSCTWQNIKGDDFDWQLRSGKTPTPLTGPKIDHTFQNDKGHYMYIETSPPIKPGMKARLVSTLLPKIKHYMCLEFWYNMYGKTVDSLKVIMQVTGYSETVVWHLKGEQGKDWLYAQVPLRGTATTYTLFFEASSGAKYTGDIAIDDIVFTENKCKISPAKAQITTAAPPVTTPAPTTPAPITGNFSCNFDNNLCGWEQSKQDDYEWVWIKGPTSSKNTGPSGDHTSGNGHYIYLETSNRREGSTANLISPVYRPDKTGVNCVSFWYYMYGAHVKTLRVFIQYGQSLPSSPIWSETGDKGKKWILGKFSFPSTAPFKVILSGVVGQSFEGDIGLDDVSITNGDCTDYDTNAYIDCSFETKDLCGFTPEKSADYQWIWHKGSTPSQSTGPNNDHTFGTSQGHYIYVKGSGPSGYARILSPKIHTTYTSCVQFYYHMRGNVGEMHAYVQSDSMTRLWYRSGHQSSAWQLATFEVQSNSSTYNIMFDAMIGGKFNGDIAIDDFSVIKGKCSDKEHCNFEKGMCVWRNTDDDDFDWIIKEADPNSGNRSPSSDHTQSLSGKGHYLFVTTEHNVLHTQAIIETTDFQPHSKSCLHFWFYGYGSDPGTLTVRIKSRNYAYAIWRLTEKNPKKLLKSGKWQEARVHIPRTSRMFTVTIEYVVGKVGYIAIDDVVFGNEKQCSRKPDGTHPDYKRPTTIPTTLAHTKAPTTPKIRVPSVRCSFTDDICGWTQDKTDDLDWIRRNGSTSTFGTGPRHDHTTKRGHYIYIESSNPAKPGDVARIISPKISLKNKEKRCLTFWYHMHGETIGSLSLLLLINGKMEGPIWKRQKSQGENWIQGKVNIGGANSLQVVFEANSGSGFYGDIALDDIAINNQMCSESESDLLPSCDFETTCNYNIIKMVPYFPWKISTPNNHPNITDHTYKTLSGEFAYVDMKFIPAHKRSLMSSPTLKPGHYCLEFFYWTSKNFNGIFTVYTLSRGQVGNLFISSEPTLTREWTAAEKNIKLSKPFRVMFQTVSPTQPQGILGLDDIVFHRGRCPRPGTCDFERGHLCFWKNDPSNQVDWTVQNGKTPTRSTGPTSDHTKHNITGVYALLEASFPAKIGDRARLVSQPIKNNNVRSCFHFWYFMHGIQVANLSVSVKTAHSGEIKYWSLTGNQGNYWKYGTILLPAEKEFFQIVIEGTIGGKYGDIAIDDLFISEYKCAVSPKKAQVFFPSTTPAVVTKTTTPPIISGKNSFNCTFEKGTCGWIQSTTDDLDWIRNKGYTPSKETGPQGDHTTGRGYYMYLEASGHRVLKEAELMFLAKNQKPGIKCMQFWYSMRGSNVGSLSVHIITDISKPEPAWKKSRTQGPSWNLASIDFNATSTFKVLITGRKGHGNFGDIALDDITLKNGACKEPYGDCDFETEDGCGYTNDPEGDFQWRRHQGRTDTSLTGPNADHTYGTSMGHYMYIETSNPRKANETARLLSPIYKAIPDEHCLQFYYNMFGEHVGSLNVKVRVHDLDNTTYDTDNHLQLTGEKGSDWLLGQVELSKLVVENPYQLIFEGVVGSGARGDIAIDDIIIKYGECKIGGNCDFDNSRCTWTNADEGDDFDWLVGSGATSTPETGPLTDHTLQDANGFYLYVESSFPRVAGEKAWYVSRDFSPTYSESRCLTFWYSMNGLGVGTLRVVIKFNTGSNNTLWELSEDQGNDWIFGQAPITSPTSYKIIFEAVRGNDHRGDIAIDDILFNDFSCSVKPLIATPRGREQTLPSVTGTTPATNLIAKSLNCTFDFGMCGWTQDTKDDFDWRENKGPTIVSNTGPMSDHNSNGTGFYLYIPTRRHRTDEKARLISPLMRPNGLQCFTVWYHMYGSDISAFNVYIFTGPKLPVPILHLSGSKENKWLRADIQFTSLSPYNVILEAYASHGPKSEIAIDDVSIVTGQCNEVSFKGAVFCTFENGLCNFTHDKDNQYKWKIKDYIRLPDHTSGSEMGKFIFIQRLPFIKVGEYAALSTPIYSVNSSDICLDFWFYMSQRESGTLRVTYLTNKDNFRSSKTIFIQQGSNEVKWLQATRNIDASQINHIQFKFYGIYGQNPFTIMGLDDIRISSQSCNGYNGDCDFERGTCNWVNVREDDFDWIIGSGRTTTSKSGPIQDHSLGTLDGSYLYIQPEPNAANENGGDTTKFSILESETFTKDHLQCFQFYYFMNGAKDGALEILFHPEGSQSKTSLWRLDGHQSKNWTRAQVLLPSLSPTYQVIIKGFRGPTFNGQIAIDDLKFTDTFPCEILPSNAGIRTTTAIPLTTTPTPIVGFDCAFDKDLCGWHQDMNSKFKWSRQKGLNNGPSADHTGGGYFLYIDSTNMASRAEASIMSPNLQVTTKWCLSFYYYMAGEDLNTLSIGFRNSDELKILWKREGPQGNQWNLATINVPIDPDSVNGTIQLTGTGPKVGASGFMAVDDISLHFGECKAPEKKSEIDCNFEGSHVCGYTHQVSSFSWFRGSGGNKMKIQQPDTDHTYQTPYGHYMYLNYLPITGRGGPGGLLWSPKFVAKKDSCLTFWYRMFGSNIGSLQIRFSKTKKYSSDDLIVWSRRGDQGNNWNQEYINIVDDGDLFVLFEGLPGTAPSNIAIDDVKLMHTCAEPGDCSFEIDSCGWHNANNNDLDWQRLDIVHITFYKHLPLSDHTMNNMFGHYMFFTSRDYVNPGKKGDLLSVSFDPTSEKGLCFEFWFIISGFNYGNLTVFKKSISANMTKLWQFSKTRGDSWVDASFHVKSFEPYEIIFRATKGSGSEGYIAIDDINYSTKLCAVTPADAEIIYPSTTPMTTTKATTVGPTIPPSPFDCTFEEGLCQWTQATDDDFNWLIGTGFTHTEDTGPIMDHTTREPSGHYIYIESSYPRLPNDTARLESPVFTSTKMVCVSFWYHMYGESVHTLNFYTTVYNSSKMELLWTRSGTLNRKWYQGYFFIFPKPDTRIILEAIRGDDYRGDIAIDDIKVVHGSCPQKPKSCNFDDGHFCSYKQSGSDDFDWSVGSPKTLPFLPKTDHSLQSDLGKFMYVDGNHTVNATTEILGPVMHSSFGSCVKFWYNLNGAVTLNVYLVSASVKKMLNYYQESTNGTWSLGGVNMKSTSTWEVMFEAVINERMPSSYIAIDDIGASNVACGMPGDCDFEYDNCYWFNDNDDDFDWVVKQAGIGTTGPKTDHTLRRGEGSYFFIESSYPQKPGDKAIIRSSSFMHHRFRRCLKFWYSMHGGQLEVLDSRKRALWRITGSHGDSKAWKYAQVPLRTFFWDRSVSIVGIIGAGHKSYIALDDIIFLSSSCELFPNGSFPINTTPAPTTPTTTSASTVPPTVYDCSFEKDICSWKQSTNDDFDWKRAQGPTRTAWTGPEKDHTTGTALGWYIYIEASRPRKQGDTAILVSPTFKSNTQYCFRFYYFIYGTTLGQISAVMSSHEGKNLTLWTRSKSHGQVWKKEAFRVPKQDTPFTISFHGKIGSNIYGDIALDDISVNEGDCPDNGPLNCTFETIHLCGYKNPDNHGAKWNKHSFGKGSKFGPDKDHTLSSVDGTYMFLEVNSAGKAQLVSSVIKRAPDMCMSFYYKFEGKSEGYFSVYQQTGNTTGTPIWTYWHINQSWWEKGQVTLPAQDNYKVVFEGKLSNNRSAISMDDISTVPGLCPEPGNCNFEKDKCMWKYAEGKLVWSRGSGSSPASRRRPGPTIDHTTLSDKGFYLVLDSLFRNPHESARIRSMSFPPTSGRCMRFWYNMNGKGMGGLKIYFVDSKSENQTAIWDLSGNQGSKWLYAQVAFAWPDIYYVLIEGTIGASSDSDIAIDDISFTQDYCATTPVTAKTGYDFHGPSTVAPPTWSPTHFDCTFETGLCSWQQGTNDDFDWSLNYGKTPSRLTGPTTDHTLKTKNGHYIYIETSNDRKPNDKAHLESPSFVPTQAGCLQFWYFMYGPDVNTLTVYMKKNGSLSAVWTKTGNIDPSWHQAIVPIHSNDVIQIVFEGLNGRHMLGDIAIDDIAFSFKGCQTTADMSCGFEDSNICGFSQGTKDSLDWNWYNGKNHRIRRQMDHTFGTSAGHYMTFAGSKLKPGQNAVLVSPTYLSVISKCIEFWYYMSKEKSGSLNVYSAINGTRMKLWSRTGNQGDVWSLAQMNVQQSGTFHIEIEGITDMSMADISIDDFGLFEGECPKPGNCDFEKGWCTWNNNRSDDFDWGIGTGYLGMFGAPRQDHTTNSITGHFIFLQVGYQLLKGSKAQLYSEVFDGTFHDCMSFWYYMSGAGTGTLNIYTITEDSKTLSWTLTGNQPYIFWAYAQFPIHHNQKAFKILIEGIKGESSKINIAIDDVFFKNENCHLIPRYATVIPPTESTPTIISTTLKPTPVPTRLDCTFEKGMCLWKQDTNDNFDWIRSQGPMGSNITGPIYDHTVGNNNGWYIYTDMSGNREPFDISHLSGPNITASKDRCFNFWYHMHGSYVSTLSVILSVNGTLEKKWTRSGDQGDVWREASFSLTAQQNTTYQIFFEGSRSILSNGEIAIDDVRFTNNRCHADNPTFCDFEDDLCNYTQVQTDGMDWIRGAGKTPTFFTGPSTDHTTGTIYGHYMFIEASEKEANQKAQLLSPKYKTSTMNCLHFHYHMFGEHINELNLYRVEGEGLTEMGSPIWSRKYNQGNIWNEGQVSISPGDNYHIMFEGKVGKGLKGDIAIDDIYQTPGACQIPGFCDFEKDFCTWKNIDTDQFDWLRSKGYTDTKNTGPGADHTLRNPEGYYVYIETSDPRSPGDVARLQSVDFPPSEMGVCLRFWYQMNGRDVDSLNVLVQNINEKGEGFLWSQKGNNGPEWLYAQLSVDRNYTIKPYYLIFEGVRGDGYSGDIAIDDIGVSHGQCTLMPEYADPKLLALKKVECSFDENNMCDWQDIPGEESYHWVVTKGPVKIYNSGPKADHSGSGYYIYADKAVLAGGGNKATLYTPIIGPTTGEGNCFTFYYNMHGMQEGKLNIYTVHDGKKTLRWTKSGDQGQNWHHGHFNIKSKFNYQIYIESISSTGYSDVIALDDIGMDPNTCPPSRVCNFDLDSCGWTPQKLYDPWQHAMNPTPIADHSTGTKTGGFIYTNASSGIKSRTIFRMMSPSFPPATQSCLKFWYYMDGLNPGSLNVYVKLPYTEKKIWTRDGNHGTLWWQAHVNVGKPLVSIVRPFKFIFEAIQNPGSSDNGITIIDDVEHLPGPCFINGLCDFEQDLCGFSNVYGDNFDWIRGSGKTDTSDTGPSADHTLRTPRGHYMFMEGSLIERGQRGLLTSWVQEKTKGSCFRFWYNMHGSGIGELNVYMWSPTISKLLWSKRGNQGQEWLSASFTITCNTTFSVVFEGVRGPNYQSDIAIDDIEFLEGPCGTQTTPSVGIVTQPPTPASMFRCNFERSFCGWKQDTSENADWILGSGLSSSDGPAMDHTKDNKLGGYIRLNSSSININRTARLMSDIIFQDTPICLTFWYHMHGENPGRLNVYVKNMGEKKDPVWTKTGSQGMAWRYAEIEIAQPEKSNKIYFEAIRSSGFGDVSLDDIDLLLDNCPTRDFCDFEEPEICGYEQGDTDIFDWTWANGNTPTFKTGPKNDHTYGTKFGHYMYIETDERSINDHAHLYSPVYPATSHDRCLNFWYNMNGKDVAKLNVYLYQNNQIGDQLWSLQMDQGPHWHLASVPVKSDVPFQLLFEGIRGHGVQGDIAIDDVKLSKEACDALASCTFEEGMCGWENLHDIGGADFDWERMKGAISPHNVGPSIDHTIGDKSGFYMFVNPIHWQEGAIALLKSQIIIPQLQSTQQSYCFYFWYDVYGINIGQLKVDIVYHGETPKTIWSQKGFKESKWRQGMVSIVSPYSHFEVMLAAVVGTGNKGHIAVDDLQLQSGICPGSIESTYTCHSGQKISSSKVCDFLLDCPDSDDEEKCGSCLFEDDMCTWEATKAGMFNWTRIQAKSHKTYSGIKTDHTMKTPQGWFAYFIKSNHRNKYGPSAILQNRALQQTSSTCQLKFWYYFTGVYANYLSLRILEGGKVTEIWKQSNRKGKTWNMAIANIGKISRPFKLQFLGHAFAGNKADIAIDDIELENCNFPAPEESCTDREFQCKRMGCVDKSRICDLSDDCGDGSDETGCQNYTSCDFETSLCYWSQEENDDFDWTRQDEATESLETGPSRDHSKGTASGYYIYAESSYPRKKGDKTRLVSPVIKPTNDGTCWIRFFYHMKGFRMGNLNVYTRTSVLGSHQNIWTKRGHVGDVWEKANVKLSSGDNFQVVFEAEINGPTSDIALDDITLTPGCKLADFKVQLPNGTISKPTKSPCIDGLFHCKSSECILESQVCDFTNHCKDNSDEDICGTCDFEYAGNCGWRELSTGRFKWQSHQGDSPGLYGPLVDHTSRSDIGKYMIVLGNSGIYESHAILETRPFGAAGDSCQVEFYVFMENNGAGQISLNVINPITHEITKEVVRVTGDQGDEWKRIVGNIGAQPAGFALQFDALPNIQRLRFGSLTDMAIDDVKLINCAPNQVTTRITEVTTKQISIKTTSQVVASTKKSHSSLTSPSKTVISTTKMLPEVSSKPSESTSKASTVCGKDSFTCPTGAHKCLPSTFRCDGHQDCEDNYDEDHCESCPKGQTYCFPKRQCISSRRCDGVVDCPDGSDEAACKECQDGFCLNGGTCKMTNGSPRCECKDENVNFRCLVIRPFASKSRSKKVWVIPVGVIFALIVTAGLFSLIYIFWIRKSRTFVPQENETGVTNPAYDYGTNLPAAFSMIELEPSFEDPPESSNSPTSIENPLYGTTENLNP